MTTQPQNERSSIPQYAAAPRVSGWGSSPYARRVLGLSADERRRIDEGGTILVEGPTNRGRLPAYRIVVRRGSGYYTRVRVLPDLERPAHTPEEHAVSLAQAGPVRPLTEEGPNPSGAETMTDGCQWCHGRHCSGMTLDDTTGAGDVCGAQHTRDGASWEAEASSHACDGCGEYVCATHCYEGGLCPECTQACA